MAKVSFELVTYYGQGKWRRELPAACRNGHPYTPENMYPNTSGKRDCKLCAQARSTAYYHRVHKDASYHDKSA